ncbi:hypothetical protein VTK56DRAFT_8663 [Thermocarpiscus australiensis]
MTNITARSGHEQPGSGEGFSMPLACSCDFDVYFAGIFPIRQRRAEQAPETVHYAAMMCRLPPNSANR